MPEMQIRYLISGPTYLPYLMVSLSTLRKFHDGPVVVYAYPESFELVSLIAQDKRIDIQAKIWDPVPRKDKRDSQFVEKLKMVLSENEPVVYLDSDTIIRDKLDGLQQDTGITATQINDTTGFNRQTYSRIRRLLRFPEIDSAIIRKALRTPDIPMLNGGVFWANPKSSIVSMWLEWSLLADQITHIPDEIVLNILQTLDDVRVVRGYNGSVHSKDQRVLHGASHYFWKKHDGSWFKEFETVKQLDLGMFHKWSDIADLCIARELKGLEVVHLDKLIRRKRLDLKT